MADDLARLHDVASAAEVAAWLDRLAGDQLEERAARILAFERAATLPDIEPPASVSGTRVISPVEAPPPPRPPPDRDRTTQPAIGSVIEAIETTRVNAVPPACEPIDAPRPPVRDAVAEKRRQRIGLALGAVVLAVTAAAAGWAMRGRGHVQAWEAPVSPSAPSVAPVPVEPPRVEPPAPTVEPIAPTAALAPVPSAAASPAPPPAAEPVPAPKRDEAVRPSSHAPRRGRPAARPAAECAPYTVDAKGHTHFNPACL
jgi:hypothetical protein